MVAAGDGTYFAYEAGSARILTTSRKRGACARLCVCVCDPETNERTQFWKVSGRARSEFERDWETHETFVVASVSKRRAMVHVKTGQLALVANGAKRSGVGRRPRGGVLFSPAASSWGG